MSFSVVAVAVLLLATASGAYFTKKEIDRAEDARRDRLLECMGSSIEEVRLEVGLYAAAQANAIVSCWKEYPVNETRLSQRYSSSVHEYLRGTFPRHLDGFSLEASNWSGALFFVEKQTMDVAPPEEPEAGTMVLEGTEMEYERLPPPTTDELAVTTANPYYIALGNFSVVALSEAASLSKDLSFDRPIISALPFLETKLRAFEAASDGELSDMGQLVGYMLTTLAQLRALEGYGVPTYTGLDTAAILTEQDVYRAVAVSLLIEQVRLFRDFDGSFADQVVEACGGGSLGISALAGFSGRCLDPAELFLWFLGKAEPELDPRMLVAQAVAGLADQLVLKMMDYMGWLGALGLADQALDLVDDTVDSLVEYLTGEDQDLAAVVSWVRRTVELACELPDAHTTAFRADSDFVVYVPERQYFVEDASGALYPVWVGGSFESVDVPSHDILSSGPWADFYPDFKDRQASLTGLLYDSIKRLSFDLASACTVELSGMAFDPADGTDLFTAMSERAGDIEVTISPEAAIVAGEALPMFSSQYSLSQAFAAFVAERAGEMVPPDIEDAMFDDIAERVLAGASAPYIPDLAVPVSQQLRDIVRNDVEGSAEWGVGLQASDLFDMVFGQSLEGLSRAVCSSVTEADDSFLGPLVDSVATALIVGSSTFPGLPHVAEEALSAFARAALAQGRMSPFKRSAYLDAGGDFQFWDGDLDAAEASGSVLDATASVEVPGGLPPLTAVPYDPEADYTSVENLFPADEVLVQVKAPWDYDRSSDGYPNLHLTSLTNVSATPYSAQWLVSVRGLVQLRAACSDPYLVTSAEPDPVVETPVLISICVPVLVHSAWPLEGVEYNPTNTALSDALDVASKFCDYLWDKLEPALGWVREGLEALYHFVRDAFTTLASFTMKVVKVVSRCIQAMVETLQTYLQKFADSVLGKAVGIFVDLVGNVELRVSMHGLTLIIRTNLPDLLFKKSQDLVRIIVCTDRFGPGIAFGFRIAKLTDGRFDVVVNGTLTFESGSVEVVVDPLMIILRRFVEVHCRTDTWALDMVMPEAEPYETAEVSTSDLPGASALLSNIPIPMLGVSASVEAGLRMKYTPPFPTDVVVNEFEANPKGDDSGAEWVELYNPLDEPRCVDGWTLRTTHGEGHEMPLSGTVPANGRLVFTFPETAIDNGYPGDPLNDGDSLVLLDTAGKTVDVTPTLSDDLNDGRTHQRSWDGGPKWALKEGTMGLPNGAPILLATSDFIAQALFTAFKEAFDETRLTEVSASLDFVALLAKRVLHHFIENLLSIVKEVIHEVILYVKVVFSDATGAAGLGVRASFVVTGEAIVDLLRWLIHTVAAFIVNVGRAGNPAAYPPFPTEFFSGLFVRFDVLMEVGTPRMVAALGVTSELEGRLTCVATIGPNLPCLGKLAGRDWGQWRVDFGVYLERVPREYVSGFLLKDTGDEVDLWLMRGSVYGP
ncbi:MAG: lamin tail domain-containing protein [Candidatus Thermoplasmatota archaeon]